MRHVSISEEATHNFLENHHMFATRRNEMATLQIVNTRDRHVLPLHTVQWKSQPPLQLIPIISTQQPTQQGHPSKGRTGNTKSNKNGTPLMRFQKADDEPKAGSRREEDSY
ncbi:hypothetical protein OUZ56_029269 [Daphnia magna]|uniref:Uncharacterized protein n=1 Tax=Daphnia magna TaxID=35525 RepID=A0ABR0B6C1_9CRUS|nr:hypothetical protein OUZ56_029269 [Daphnia magna]